jgi:hypothetical protein
MSIPDAPWVGKCREDYYGYDEEEQTAYCEGCCNKFDRQDLIEEDGFLFCKDCYELNCDVEETDDEELHG